MMQDVRRRKSKNADLILLVIVFGSVGADVIIAFLPSFIGAGYK
jgi:hypothetical protein